MKEVFTEDPFDAYAKLSKVPWSSESFEVYANSIRKMAGFIGKDLEKLKMTFINHISIDLQQLPGVHIIVMEELITCTRVLSKQK